MCFLSQLFTFTQNNWLCLREDLPIWHYFVCIWLLKGNKQWKITQFSTERRLYIQNLQEWVKLCTIHTIPRQNSSPVTATIFIQSKWNEWVRGGGFVSTRCRRDERKSSWYRVSILRKINIGSVSDISVSRNWQHYIALHLLFQMHY